MALRRRRPPPDQGADPDGAEHRDSHPGPYRGLAGRRIGAPIRTLVAAALRRYAYPLLHRPAPESRPEAAAGIHLCAARYCDAMRLCQFVAFRTSVSAVLWAHTWPGKKIKALIFQAKQGFRSEDSRVGKECVRT